MLSVILLSVIVVNVIMLSVAVPLQEPKCFGLMVSFRYFLILDSIFAKTLSVLIDICNKFCNLVYAVILVVLLFSLP
jgi:hypothetical protein